MVLILIIFAILLVMGLPIAIVLGATGFIHLVSTGEAVLLQNLLQKMISNLNNFTMLAIPFFILVGELMNATGITTKLINFSKSLIGYVRGGLGYANVVVALFLGAIIGSPNAEAAIRSATVVPEMEKDGFSREFSAALTATSSILGSIFPPSIIFIIYGVLASTSIGALFIAGIIPAIIIAIAHMIVIFIYVRKKGEQITKHPFPTSTEFLINFYKALPALSIPVIILGGIYTGYFTPTESAAIACFIAIMIGFLGKTLKLSDFPRVFFRTGVVTASVTFIIATANIIGFSLTIERIPHQAADFLLGISENPLVLLLIINIMLLIVGMFIEITAALIIMVPILVPIVTSVGIDPVHFGVILCINMAIGFVTPPVGTALFITSSLTKTPLIRLAKACIPFFGIIIVSLLVITYLPELSLWLPKMFGLME